MVTKPEITSASDIIEELEKIASRPYKEENHGRNHQVFAMALMYILYKLRYPKICSDYNI